MTDAAASAAAGASGIPGTVVFILIVELFERFCYYTIQGSQKSFMNQRLGYSNAQATTISLVWGTLCYLTCLGGGVLGDRFLGKYLTVAILASWYVGGCVVLSISTLPSVNSGTLFLVAAFGGVAVGTGGIKPLVCNFGADQLNSEAPESGKAKEAFFFYFYWMIQIGAAVALGFMTTVATSPTQFGLKPDTGYFTSYLIASIGMALALGVFLSGTCSFQKKFLKSSNRIFRPICATLVAAARSSFRGGVALFGWCLTIPFFILVFWQTFAPDDQQQYLAWMAFAVAVVQFISLVWAHSDNWFLSLAAEARSLGNQQAGILGEELSARDIQLTFQTIPVLLVANTVFNFAYSMMLGPFYNQSCQMDLRLGSSQINGAVFNLADTLVIIVGIPLFEKVIFPMVTRRTGRDVRPDQKLLLGFFFSALAMAAASGLELMRRASPVVGPQAYLADPGNITAAFPGFNFHGDDGPYAYSHYDSVMGACKVDGVQWCSNCAAKIDFPYDAQDPTNQGGIYMSKLSGLWMFLPYGLIGIGEICVNPVLYYYAYSFTPAKTQSVIQAINLIFQGAYPPALTGVFITAFSSAMPNNLNKGMIGSLHVGLEVFYYIGAIFIVLGTPAFLAVLRTCKIEAPPVEDRAEEMPPSMHSGSFPLLPPVPIPVQ